jgi:uncharacterized membrane protein YfcA
MELGAWQDLAALAAVLIACGAVAGVVAGLLGVGGGIVIVPVLFEMLPFIGVPDDLRMHVAVGTSLAVIIPTSISSARAHHRRGAVDTGTLRTLAPSVFAGVVAGTLLAAVVAGAVLTVVFATVALLVAGNMLLRPEGARLADQLPGFTGQSGLGLFIGGVSVIMGIGGGTVGVPLLSLFNMPIHRAVATASVLGLIISVPGAIGFVLSGWAHTAFADGYLGYVLLPGAAIIAVLSTSLAPLGARIAHALPAVWLRRAFGVFLLVTAVRLYTSAF